MIKAIDLTGELIDKKINFEVGKNSKAVFVFEKEEEGEEFLKMLTGIKKPKSGEVFLMDKNLKELTRDKIFELRKKIAIVFKTGGLIHNLRVWENLVLPALYHKVSDEENIKRRGIEILEKLEFKKEPMVSVAQLTNFEKRLIGIARAFLVNPEIMILEYPFDGLSESEKIWILEKIKKYEEGLAFVYILSSEKDRLLIQRQEIKNEGN